MFWLIAGVVVTGLGVHYIQTGKIFVSARSLIPMTGWEVTGVGLALILFNAWALIRLLRQEPRP